MIKYILATILFTSQALATLRRLISKASLVKTNYVMGALRVARVTGLHRPEHLPL
jgi:hypothetical protein